MMASTATEYDLVVLGATGHTGKLTAEYITLHLPTDLKWAVAGRSEAKLSLLVSGLQSLNPNRSKPGIVPLQLSVQELTALAKRTRIILNFIGPYILHSLPVVESCAKSGTHYLDVSGEISFFKEAIDKYHDIAKANGALIISQVGIDSTPSDLLAYSLVSLLREKHSLPTKEIIARQSWNHHGPSGGTASTVFTLVSTLGLRNLRKLTSPFSISPIVTKETPRPKLEIPFLTRLTGVRTVPSLGVLTTGFLTASNMCVVHRSAGLMKSVYNPNPTRFRYIEQAATSNRLTGILTHFGFLLAYLLISIPPTRWLLRKFARQPGDGPSREDAKNESFDLLGIATADQDRSPGHHHGGDDDDDDEGPIKNAAAKPIKAKARVSYQGSLYGFSALMISQAAMVVLENESDLVKKTGGGGLLTPATLGDAYVQRCRKAGVEIEVDMMDELNS